MADHNVWQKYSAEVLAWQLGQPSSPAPRLSSAPAQLQPKPQSSATTDTTLHRLLRMTKASGRHKLILAGLGDGTLAARLLDALPPHVRLYILEPSPHRARNILTHFPHLQDSLLVDSSPWALLLLTLHTGLTPDNCTLGRTPSSAYAHEDLRILEQWRKLFFGVTQEVLPAARGTMEPLRISVGAILHPNEPHLHDFFAHIPTWIHEVCVVWDDTDRDENGDENGTIPNHAACACSAPLRQRIRPLAGDFSQQRNAMLAMCSGHWCLYLDADERLTPETWATLPALASLPGVGSVLFPRLTFEGSEDNIRMGYGLWPDVQCRFFARNAATHFQGTVHEHLHDLEGQSVLAPGMPIYHYSHIQKNRAQVEEKLRVFTMAGAQSSLHVGSAAYPSLPRTCMEQACHAFGSHTALRLPLRA